MSFGIALSGLSAINQQLDTISNNIANTGTVGFKSGRANFASMYAGGSPNGVYVGSITQTVENRGGVTSTGRQLDAMINGKGFFVTKDTDGSTLYTRAGIFGKDADGYMVDHLGRKLQGYDETGAFGDLQVPMGQIPPVASDQLTYKGNMSLDWPVKTFDPLDPSGSSNESQTATVYDSLGREQTVTMYFARTATDEVEVHYFMNGAEVQDGAGAGITSTLTFANGVVGAGPYPPLDLGTTPPANPLVVNLDFAGTTMYGGDSSTSTKSANGHSTGTYTDVALDKDGNLMVTYSNGMKRSAGTLAIANFANADGLQATGDTSWKASMASGDPLYGTPGQGMAGDLTPGALEASNADVTNELVSLMTANQNYQANSKVISTQSEMMQVLMQSV